MNQKLSDWASVAEIVSGFAVVVTLIFLIVEIRGNTEALLTQAIGSQRQEEHARRMVLIENTGGVADLLIKARTDQPMSEVEQLRIFVYSNELLDSLEWQLGEIRAGRLPEDQLNLRAWRANINSPNVLNALEITGNTRDPEFMRFLEENILGER